MWTAPSREYVAPAPQSRHGFGRVPSEFRVVSSPGSSLIATDRNGSLNHIHWTLPRRELRHCRWGPYPADARQTLTSLPTPSTLWLVCKPVSPSDAPSRVTIYHSKIPDTQHVRSAAAAAPKSGQLALPFRHHEDYAGPSGSTGGIRNAICSHHSGMCGLRAPRLGWVRSRPKVDAGLAVFSV